MKRFAACLLVLFTVGVAEHASAHGGGHHGGCDEFGHLNHAIGHDPVAFGFPDARNLGDVISDFARAVDGQPGVGDIVENVDHLVCGEG
jgi:hypothetical protein